MEASTSNHLKAKIEDLEQRLADAEHLIEAIRTGEVDAFAIQREDAHEVYTLQSGDYAYRVLVERFSEGALNLAEDGLIVYTNNSFCKLINKPYENVVGTSVYDYITPDSKERFNTLFTQSLSGQSKGEINIGLDGDVRPVYISLTSLQPNLATIGMIITDLTEKKSNERIITGYQGELELKNRLLANKNKSLEQQILNEFTESFAEYKTGNEFFDSLTLTLAEKTQLDYALIAEIIQGKEEHPVLRSLSFVKYGSLVDNFENQLLPGTDSVEKTFALSSFPDSCGTRFPQIKLFKDLEVEGYIGCPLFDTQKNPIGVIALMHRKKIEDLPYVESLLKIAAKRTEMEMERIRNEHVLAAKNAELQDQNEELASFSYIASHDLQEPLRKIQAFSSRILEKESRQLSESGKDYFLRISDAASRMQKLIEALLNYSRTNTTEIILEPTDLNLVLGDVQRDLQEMINEKKVVIEASSLPTVNIVPLQFHQLFANIISNAIKYSKPDVSPHIKITTDVVSGYEIAQDIPSAPRYWKISVADNGIGFEPQHQNRVFELFQRLHGKKEYEGTGIGLAICKKIMHNHKGYITAEGKPGVGATFNIYLPYTT